MSNLIEIVVIEDEIDNILPLHMIDFEPIPITDEFDFIEVIINF